MSTETREGNKYKVTKLILQLIGINECEGRQNIHEAGGLPSLAELDGPCCNSLGMQTFFQIRDSKMIASMFSIMKKLVCM